MEEARRRKIGCLAREQPVDAGSPAFKLRHHHVKARDTKFEMKHRLGFPMNFGQLPKIIFRWVKSSAGMRRVAFRNNLFENTVRPTRLEWNVFKWTVY